MHSQPNKTHIHTPRHIIEKLQNIENKEILKVPRDKMQIAYKVIRNKNNIDCSTTLAATMQSKIKSFHLRILTQENYQSGVKLPKCNQGIA